LGQWEAKNETAAFDPAEIIRVLHEGRRPSARVLGSVATGSACRDADGGVNRGVHSPRARFGPHAALCAFMRQAAQELGHWDTKSEAARFDVAEMVRILHEGPQASAERLGSAATGSGRAVDELEQGNAKNEPGAITAS
jgi:hypothetical protein